MGYDINNNTLRRGLELALQIDKLVQSADVFIKAEDLQKVKDFSVTYQMYSAAIKEIRTKLEILDDEFKIKFDYNPIHNIESRLKAPASIVEKLNKKGFDVSVQSIRDNIFDVAGIRVICNYIKNPKENGYRSLHLIVSVPIFLAESTEHIKAEVQLRTIAMDYWASLEHELRYKTTGNVNDDLKKRLTACATLLADMDVEMQDIFKIIYKQN